MNKKIVCVFGAILAFFAGGILVSEAPITGSLVAFLDTVAGFACGYFFKKYQDEERIAFYEDQYCEKSAELMVVEQENESLKSASKKKATKAKES